MILHETNDKIFFALLTYMIRTFKNYNAIAVSRFSLKGVIGKILIDHIYAEKHVCTLCNRIT